MVQRAPGASAKPRSGASSQKLESWATSMAPTISASSLTRAGPEKASRKSRSVSPVSLVSISR